MKNKKQREPSKEEIDEWKKKCKVGEYREWKFDVDRIKELSMQVTKDAQDRRIGKTHERNRYSEYQTKKSKAKEIERIRQEIENG